MFRFRFICSVVVTVVMGLAVVPAQAASGPHRGLTGSGSVSSPGSWGWLKSLWSEVGCSLDPGGHCVAAPKATPPISRGTGLAAPWTNVGCSIDPGGRCQ